jgi:hypothetical protein
VVHRDIKPDNVMLSGRHALVTDFGVAKAVSEATGRNKLTTAGIALGTPAYMAPEQAAADPNIDHRVDIYALGAMGYELLTGRPPFTGLSAQEILAAHVTQRPEPLTNRRPACPPAVAAVLMKCLEKRPADRWQTAEELLAQLEPLATPSGGMTPTQTRPVEGVRTDRAVRAVAVAGGITVLLAAAVFLGMSRRHTHAAATLRNRTQITSTGRVNNPAISSDGKQLAYVVAECGERGCRYGVEIQDVGSLATRRVLDSATAAYWVTWSPDRRNLVFGGTLGGRYGTHLVSLLGGPARFLASGQVTFFAGGDSLLISPIAPPDSVSWLLVAGLDGVPRDSIRIPGDASYMWPVRAVPNAPWLIVALSRQGQTEFRTIGRDGHEGNRWTFPGLAYAQDVSSEALWLQANMSGANASSMIVQVPLDARTGRFFPETDTVHVGPATGFGVTTDGKTLVFDEGTTEYSGWALEFADLLRGSFPEQRRWLRSTTPVALSISPYGDRVVVRRTGTGAAGSDQLSALPYGGGGETPVALSGRLLGWSWGWDSTVIGLGERIPAGLRLSRVDLRTGARAGSLVLPDSTVSDWDALPGGGWVWVPPDGSRLVRVQAAGEAKPRSLTAPDWYQLVYGDDAAADGQRVAITGFNASTVDSEIVSVMTLSDGRTERWATFFGEDAGSFWRPDGSIAVQVRESQGSLTIFRLRGPGRIERLGTIPRTVNAVRISIDLKRAVVVTRDYHGDAWMNDVVRP